MKRRYDYFKEENCYLVIYHNVKRGLTKKIKVEWFDLNYGEKFVWLLVREYTNDKNEIPVYRNIKFDNIDRKVEKVFGKRSEPV